MLYLLPRRLPAWQWADFVAPALALGQAVGRMGCLAAGCCYGKPTYLPWAIHFHDPDSLAPIDVGLHPTQIYDALCGVVIFAILCVVRRHKRFHGQVMLVYLVLYTIARTAVELFRGDRERGLFFGGLLSTSQLISIALLATAVLLYWRRSRTVRRAAA
jgi:phosphatidylglycerol:prolipoprotein diacylglycerol transferase